MHNKKNNEIRFISREYSRRKFIKTCAMGTAVIASSSILGFSANKKQTIPVSGPAVYRFPLNQDWLFGGKFTENAAHPGFPDKDFARTTFPHCVANLSWQNWDPSLWSDVWIYRRHFELPGEMKGRRVFLNFEGVMVGTTPVINGHSLPLHLGGYLPSNYEITEWLKESGNLLAVKVDSRWSNVPPEGSPNGRKRIDYLEAGGIIRSSHLQAVPQIFISDVFVKPVNVLESNRRLEIKCTINSGLITNKNIQIKIDFRDGSKIIVSEEKAFKVDKEGETEVNLVLSKLGNIKLWDVKNPYLYNIIATLFVNGEPVHDYKVRTGLRDAKFEVDGFFLNGKRLRLFGLNRHEIYPYVGFAMPDRVMRRDAEILHNEFNCNSVRCSHYPQSEAFLNACDELGLMVWEEVPGWGYLGDESWKELLVRDVREMVMRDRNHPSIIIWGVRVNESPNDPVLYRTTREVAKSLDDSRPTSGSMTGGSIKTWKEDWHQDVFAFDDYHADPNGGVGIRAPLPGVPYMLAEAVGQFNYKAGKNFNNTYRRAGDIDLQQQQAVWHAQAHSKAASYPRMAGVIAWCGFDYASLINSYNGVKCPGVADIFRIPKLGASFYFAQIDPEIRPVIKPNFYWDFGKETPKGPGKNVSIFSNCSKLELFIDEKKHSTIYPDSKNYPHIKYPPFFADLEIDGKNNPELRIDGYVNNKLLLSKSFSSDTSKDRFYLKSDDNELIGDGIDATRLIFKVVDEFEEDRLYAGGEVKFKLSEPGIIVGDNPFMLKESGGVGAVWIKTTPNSSGNISIDAVHSSLGKKSILIKVKPENNQEINK